MQYEIEINGRLRQVVVRRADGRFTVTVDGRERTIDAARIDAHTLSLIVSEEVRLKGGATEAGEPATQPDVASGFSRTRSHEVTVAPDPASGQLMVRVGTAPLAVSLNGRRRWGVRDDAGHAGSGPQRIAAPMPGKIVRVLVKTGEAVRARQPIVVIEAMKMENELRSGKDGAVAEIHVQEGQSVDAGALLVVIQ
jgi:biotin carboxyl carrier protein